MIILPYKIGTTLEQIISDGWSRDLTLEQTLGEAALMGFTLTPTQLRQAWYEEDATYLPCLCI